MSSELVYKLVIVDRDKEILSKTLSYSAVVAILNELPDLAEHGDLYQVAAKHPSRDVRGVVAQKNTISAAICNVLASDASIEVLRNLTSNASFKEYATMNLLKKFIEKDVDIAKQIAWNIDAYQRANLNKLAVLISGHPDPDVLACLAACRSAPKKILKALLTHLDPHVSAMAQENLGEHELNLAEA